MNNLTLFKLFDLRNHITRHITVIKIPENFYLTCFYGSHLASFR